MSVPFTKYEAALLLNAYLETGNCGISLYEAAKRCSTVLRQMAANQRQKIDNTYRSVKGITCQIASMESAYKGRTIARPATRLFVETVRTYRDNRKCYDELLEEARRMAGVAKADVKLVSDAGKVERMIPESLLSAIRQYYGGGMRFDDTVLRLLEENSDIKISKDMEIILKSRMFRRSDNLYFLPDMVSGKEQLALLERQAILENVANFGCVDIHALYSDFCRCGAETCLRNEDDLADYVAFALPRVDIRIASVLRTKIIRKTGVSVRETLEQSANRVVCTIKQSGCITEDELLILFPVFSDLFLHGLLEKYTDEIVPAKINDFLCYQTVESMGLEPGFSSILNEVLEEADRLSLPLSKDIIHAMLSVRLGYNMREEFNIPDDKTFRRIISVYYTGSQPRAWKSGSFVEVNGGHV